MTLILIFLVQFVLRRPENIGGAGMGDIVVVLAVSEIFIECRRVNPSRKWEQKDDDERRHFPDDQLEDAVNEALKSAAVRYTKGRAQGCNDVR